MEDAGAVFLPAAGQRSNTKITNVGTYGYYWSANALENAANCYGFQINNGYYWSLARYFGGSVRLVKDVK